MTNSPPNTVHYVSTTQGSISHAFHLRPRLPSQRIDARQQPSHQRSSRPLTTPVYPHAHTLYGEVKFTGIILQHSLRGVVLHSISSWHALQEGLFLPAAHANDSLDSLHSPSKCTGSKNDPSTPQLPYLGKEVGRLQPSTQSNALKLVATKETPHSKSVWDSTCRRYSSIRTCPCIPQAIDRRQDIRTTEELLQRGQELPSS